MLAYEDKLKAFLAKEARDRNIELDHSSLLESGIIDSLGIMKLVQFIETEWKIVVADDEIMPDNFESITTIVKLLESKSKPR